ncbi:MAG TPA: tripartite tricarboxylate transporter substrate binding protein [Xanthobacteraceae bacterium]
MSALRAVAVLALGMLMLASAHAAEWPAKPVRIVVAFGAGGSADVLGRLIAAELTDVFHQRFYVENRPGNSGSIGSALVARAEPDGYTLLIGGSGPHLTGPAINPHIGYDPMGDFTHIAMIAGDTYALAVNPTLGAHTLDDVIRLAREKPLASASPGPGSLGHLLLLEFNQVAGIQIEHIPSPGGSVTDVLGNHVPLALTTVLTVGQYLRVGTLTGIALTSPERNPAFPDIPTFAEQGFPQIHGSTWFWLTAPKGLPPPIVGRLNRAVRQVVRAPRVEQYFRQQALMTMDLDVAGVNKFLRGELAYWAPLAKASGLRVP